MHTNILQNKEREGDVAYMERRSDVEHKMKAGHVVYTGTRKIGLYLAFREGGRGIAHSGKSGRCCSSNLHLLELQKRQG